MNDVRMNWLLNQEDENVRTVRDTEYRRASETVLAVSDHSSGTVMGNGGTTDNRWGHIKYFNFLASNVTTISYHGLYGTEGVDATRRAPEMKAEVKTVKFEDITDPKDREEVRDMHTILQSMNAKWNYRHAPLKF